MKARAADYQAPLPLLGFAEQLQTIFIHLHDSGMVHADVKPDNVCVSPSGGLVLIDFGESYTLPNRTPYASGTLLYKGLCAHRCEPVGPRWDSQGLVYTMIQLYCGRLPWDYPRKKRDDDRADHKVYFEKRVRSQPAHMRRFIETAAEGGPAWMVQLILDAWVCACRDDDYGMLDVIRRGQALL